MDDISRPLSIPLYFLQGDFHIVTMPLFLCNGKLLSCKSQKLNYKRKEFLDKKYQQIDIESSKMIKNEIHKHLKNFKFTHIYGIFESYNEKNHEFEYIVNGIINYGK